MTWLRVSSARVFALFYKDRIETEIDEELRFHLAMRTAENIRAGMPPPEASRAANRRLGNVDLIKDACRDVSGAGALETVWQDLRFAARMLLKDGHQACRSVPNSARRRWRECTRLTETRGRARDSGRASAELK